MIYFVILFVDMYISDSIIKTVENDKTMKCFCIFLFSLLLAFIWYLDRHQILMFAMPYRETLS